MYRSNDYLEDLMDTDPSMPSQNPIFRGAGFTQQTMSGVTFNDPSDDRVAFIGDAYDPTVQHMRSLSLPADLDSDGIGATKGGIVFGPVVQSPNPNRNANIPTNTDPGGVVLESTNDGQWYDTLRPHAGFQLPLADDQVYADVTGDQMGETWASVHDPLLVELGNRANGLPDRRALDMPSRNSVPPSTDQAVVHGFGSQLGAWEWSGMKTAMERTVADPGPFFEQPLADRVPNPTGAGGAMTAPDAYNLYPQMLTFRAPPTPWDVGPNSDNGNYVDSGY